MSRQGGMHPEVIGFLTEKARYRGPERVGRRVDAIATGENQD